MHRFLGPRYGRTASATCLRSVGARIGIHLIASVIVFAVVMAGDPMFWHLAITQHFRKPALLRTAKLRSCRRVALLHAA
ncbi:hypothetical protein C9I56_36115 [Paraburkholderia caribensis]|nr:hypothetical protein C9I56_36115 [Paraburkholderia caribensis]